MTDRAIASLRTYARSLRCDPRTFFPIVLKALRESSSPRALYKGPFFSSIGFFFLLFHLSAATHTISDKKRREERERRESVREEPRNVTLGAQLVGLLAKVT
jgi:hypothetical protein